MDYVTNAQDLLAGAEGSMVIKLSDTKLPDLDTFGHHYRVTLRGPGGSYTFDFWGSRADQEANKTPTEYDVLACLEWNCADTFEDFCSELGYEQDSRKALKTFRACLRQRTALERIFPDQTARDALADIC